jgi:glycosyltransferase involved in cell wall biosynthesis
MKPVISVVICTHNPRINYLENALAALKSQTLPFEQWELLLIDNASNQPICSQIDVTWHPQARHLHEEKLGKTYALLLAIEKAVGEIIVIVDDDNVLDSDYLEVALEISKDWSILGAWGGQIRPDFEETPPDWTKPYWWMLAIRELDRDKWSNLVYCYETSPVGAGMCVRKIVAQKYVDSVCSSPKRLNLDPKGKLLLRGGDHDLAFTSCELGLGTGVFVDLKLTHLIPPRRLEEDYLLKLAEGIEYSTTVLESIRGETPTLPKLSWFKKLVAYYRLRKMSPRDRRFHQAKTRGRALAIQAISNT